MVDDKSLMKADIRMNLDGMEDRDILDLETGLHEDCRKSCLELESKNAEERCALLKLEIQKKKSEFELLEGRFGALAVEKLAIEDELRVLKGRNDELEERLTRIENCNKVVSEKGMERIVGITEEEEGDKVFQLMIENKVLDCEKKKAENEVEIWKVKFKELESRVLELEEILLLERHWAGKLKRGLELPEMAVTEMSEAMGLKDGADLATRSTHLQTENKMVESDEVMHAGTGVISTCHHPAKAIGDLQASGAPSFDTPCKQSTHVVGGKRGILPGTGLEYGSRARKHLVFGEERSPQKKMAPSTPGGAKPASVGVIDISDSDGEPDSTMLHNPTLEIQGHQNELASNNNLKRTLLDQSDEEDMGGYRGSFPFISTPKRKRASNIVTSDSESGDDDNVPICKLKTKHLQELNPDSSLNSCSVTAAASCNKVRECATRRRLVPLRQCEVKNGPEISSPIPSNLEDSETKYSPGISTNEDVEDSESESLGGFIVDSSDVSGSDDASGESEDSSDGNMNFGEIISRIRRNRDHNLKWEFEADMLAAFGKDPELCMKAVCALYRQQTSEEKSSKGTIYSNQRGFSQCDALRGTTLAEFLTDGDPKGDLMKSVEELQEYNPKGLDLCRTLATHYSKQLFAIYKNKEDPFFLPS